MAHAAVALGSNLGDRRLMIERAIALLSLTEGIEIRRVSSIIETDPIGPGDQPRYLNAATTLDTTLSCRELLDKCLSIERRLGRDRSDTTRWTPRTIDLDLLLFGDLVIAEPGLQVPHPHMHEREFVLAPLAEIAASLVHPVLGETVESLLRRNGSAPMERNTIADSGVP